MNVMNFLTKSFRGRIFTLVIAVAFIFTTLTTAQNQSIMNKQERAIEWSVELSLTNPAGQNDNVTFGEAPDANDGPPADAYDNPKPPAPMDPYIRAWLNDNLPAPYDLLWADYRSYPDTYKVWNLSVRWVPSDYTSPTMITISWNPAAVGNSEYTSVNLYNSTTTLLKNMLVDSSYTFNCPALAPQQFKIICSVNYPPVFGTPSPPNGSTNQPLSITWGIPISDPEGDNFDWWIQCSNGQITSSTGATNGTKSLSLSGLAYSTTYTVWVNATDPTGSNQYTRRWYTFTTREQENNAPNKPERPTGEISGKINTEYAYITSTIDPDGDKVYYLWDWGDGTHSDWFGPYESGEIVQATHTWKDKGSFEIKVKAKDAEGLESEWSDPLLIKMPINSAYLFNLPLLQFFEKLFELYPHIFLMTRQLLLL